jgi:hypothetical protein
LIFCSAKLQAGTKLAHGFVEDPEVTHQQVKGTALTIALTQINRLRPIYSSVTDLFALSFAC